MPPKQPLPPPPPKQGEAKTLLHTKYSKAGRAECAVGHELKSPLTGAGDNQRQVEDPSIKRTKPFTQSRRAGSDVRVSQFSPFFMYCARCLTLMLLFFSAVNHFHLLSTTSSTHARSIWPASFTLSLAHVVASFSCSLSLSLSLSLSVCLSVHNFSDLHPLQPSFVVIVLLSCSVALARSANISMAGTKAKHPKMTTKDMPMTLPTNTSGVSMHRVYICGPPSRPTDTPNVF